MKLDPLKILKSCEVFSTLDNIQLKKISKKLEKVSLKKHQILFKQGELSENLYLLVTGNISLFLTTESHEKKFLTEVLPGQTIGELTALSHEPHAATARAMKPSILLKLSREVFADLCKNFPAFALTIMNLSINRSRNLLKLVADKGFDKKNIAIIPASLKVNLQSFYDQISTYITQYPGAVLLSDLDQESNKIFQNESKLRKYIDQINNEKKVILYLIKSYDSPLAKICFDRERVDMIYIVSRGNSKPAISQKTRNIIITYNYKIQPELILLHDEETMQPRQTSKWLKVMPFKMHHHIRMNQENDWQRLLRFFTGTAVMLVLGGGGLRCWAQLGVIAALRKMKIPIDAIGGASAGALVAGYYAMKDSFDDTSSLKELSEITRQSIKLKNLTYPSISLFNGKGYTEKLQKIFGKVRIENLWIPCFTLSTKLSNYKSVVPRSGYLWKLIRTSTSIPLIYPPVVVNGKLHLDGGLTNNLPVDIMKKISSNRGRIIAVELTHINEDMNKYNFPPILPLIKTTLAKSKLANKDYKFPSLFETFLKSLLAGSAIRQEENARIADVLITPDLSRFSLFHVKEKDELELIKIGYKEAMKKIKKMNGVK